MYLHIGYETFVTMVGTDGFTSHGLSLLYDYCQKLEAENEFPYILDVETVRDLFEEFTLSSYVERYLSHLTHEDAPFLTEEEVTELVLNDEYLLAADVDNDVYLGKV